MTLERIRQWGALALSLFVCGALFAGDAKDYDLYLQDPDDSEAEQTLIAPGTDFNVDVLVDADGSKDLQGYQWGVCMDTDYLSIEDGDVELSDDFESGDFTFESRNFVDGGWTVGALTNVITGFTIEAVDGIHLYTCTYGTSDSDVVWPTTLEFCDTLGSPEVVTRMITEDSEEVAPTSEEWTVDIVQDALFVRGDLDGDGRSGMLDAFAIILALFADGEAIGCEAAADLNDDGKVSTLDVIAILEYAYIEGPAPSAPWPDCGVSAGAACEEYDFCD